LTTKYDIVAYLFKARTVEPEKQPLIANGSEATPVSRQLLGEYVPAETDKHATIEVLLETVFFTLSIKRGYVEDNLGQQSQFCTGVCEEKRQLEGSRHSERT
jgi:hypothetical protein